MMIRIFTIFAGVLLYLFFFWKRLKDDYPQNHIFTTAFCGLILVSCGYSFSKYFIGQYVFWFSFLGAVFGYSISVLKYKMKIYEVLEAAVLALISLYAFILVAELIVTKDVLYLFSFVVMVLLVILFHLFDKVYKGLSWYKSGRIGFSGLMISGIFFTIYTLVAVTLSGVISFVGSNDALVSALLALLSFLLVFSLARKKI